MNGPGGSQTRYHEAAKTKKTEGQSYLVIVVRRERVSNSTTALDLEPCRTAQRIKGSDASLLKHSVVKDKLLVSSRLHAAGGNQLADVEAASRNFGLLRPTVRQVLVLSLPDRTAGFECRLKRMRTE